jgi:hypothetical protein
MTRTPLLGIALISVALLALDSHQSRAAEPEGLGNVTGVVVDKNDKPMVGFAVHFHQNQPIGIGPQGGKKSVVGTPPPTELQEKLIATATTDAQGRFSASKLKTGAYLLKGGSPNVGHIYQEVIVESNKTVDLGKIKLK